MYPVLSAIVWMKTFTAMVATPIAPRHIVVGHILWLTLRLTFVATVFVFAMVGFGHGRLAAGHPGIPVAVLTGLAFAAPITAFTATRRNDNAFPAITRFIVTPLFIFSGTFFPVSQLPAIVQPIAYLTPLWHGVRWRGIACLATSRPATRWPTWWSCSPLHRGQPVRLYLPPALVH